MSTAPDGSTQVNTDIGSMVAEYVQRLVGRPVGLDEPIISSQLLDSISIVQLIAFVENSLTVSIDDEDLVLANFDSVRAIVALLARTGAR